MELIDKLVNQLPQPNVGQLEENRTRRRDNQIEEVAIVKERVDTLFQLRSAGNPGMNVTIVQLFVQNQKDLIVFYQSCNFLLIRPGTLIEMMITDLGEGILIHILDVEEHSLLNGRAEVHQEIFNILRHLFGVIVPLVLHVQLWITSMTVVIIDVLGNIKKDEKLVN